MSVQHHDEVVTIVVVRTGGFAGLRRQWQVEAGDGDAERWLVLVEACPWDHASGHTSDDASDDASEQDDGESRHPTMTDEPAAESDSESAPEPTPVPEPTSEPRPGRSASRGADRFVWSIRALTPAHRLEQKLPEPELVGPWRTLVDAVRSAD